MPIYEYECPKCGSFEYEQSIKDDPLKRCPDCRRKVTKQISRSSFQLKGGGWYADSYGAGKSSNDSGKKPAPASEAASPCDSCPAKTGDSQATTAAPATG